MKTSSLRLYLTKSKVRSDLLTLLFLNPTQSYYLRELERQLGFSAGALSRELKIFSEDGLLERESKGKEVYYQMNPRHPLYAELKGLIEKTVGIPVRLSEIAKKDKDIQEAYIYGSFATGKMGADSDIDLLLVGEEGKGLRQAIKKMEARFLRRINVVTYKLDEFLKKRLDPSEFLYQVMRGALIPLKKGEDRGKFH